MLQMYPQYLEVILTLNLLNFLNGSVHSPFVHFIKIKMTIRVIHVIHILVSKQYRVWSDFTDSSRTRVKVVRMIIPE